MADLNTVFRSAVDWVAGRKTNSTARNRNRAIVIDSAVVMAPANGDTAGTAIVIPAGSRLRAGVVLSNAAGAASSTLAVGIRDNVTKVAIDATAFMAATSITSAQTINVMTGTKTSNGQFYTTDRDVEVYCTFGGATPTPNQAIRLEVEFVAP